MPRAALGGDVYAHEQQLFAGLATWSTRRLDDSEMLFTWADGVYFGAGPEDERRVSLVVVGADQTTTSVCSRCEKP